MSHFEYIGLLEALMISLILLLFFLLFFFFWQHTTDQSCLKAFLRYQGLSLLWSWMVDGGGKKAKLQKQVRINAK